MFAITFDLVVADTNTHHPKNVTQAYTDIATTLAQFGGTVYAEHDADTLTVERSLDSLGPLMSDAYGQNNMRLGHHCLSPWTPHCSCPLVLAVSLPRRLNDV